MWRQYDHFENPGTRFYFGISHFCLIGMIIVVTAIVVLLGSEWLLNSASELPENGLSGFPKGLFPK
jgi:hypothetical protein